MNSNINSKLKWSWCNDDSLVVIFASASPSSSISITTTTTTATMSLNSKTAIQKRKRKKNRNNDATTLTMWPTVAINRYSNCRHHRILYRFFSFFAENCSNKRCLCMLEKRRRRKKFLPISFLLMTQQSDKLNIFIHCKYNATKLTIVNADNNNDQPGITSSNTCNKCMDGHNCPNTNNRLYRSIRSYTISTVIQPTQHLTEVGNTYLLIEILVNNG